MGLVLCLGFFVFGLYHKAAADNWPDIATLQQLALQRKLHESRYWQVLLHYQKQADHWVSLIDDPGFFLSAQGKTDPQAELLMTIATLFGTVITSYSIHYTKLYDVTDC